MPDTFSTRHSLVTGGAGFIGSHLVEALLERGDRVTAVDNLSNSHADNLAAVQDHPRFRFVRANVADRQAMTPLVADCDAFFHLASYVGVKLAAQTSSQTILNNLRSIDTVLDLVSTYQPRFLLSSTSEVYGKALDVIGSDAPLAEHADRAYGSTEVHRWSYAGIKAVEEFLTLAKHHEEGLHTVIVRLFNVIGPRQHGRHGPVVPRFIDQALAGEPITLYGDGQQRRCFTYVGDAVAAMLLLLLDRDDMAGEIFNVGGTAPVTIHQLAETIIRLTGERSDLSFVPYEAAYGKHFEDVRLRIPDMTKLIEWTGFSCERDLEDMLRRTITAHPMYRAQKQA